jgi:hypothetical protein
MDLGSVEEAFEKSPVVPVEAIQSCKLIGSVPGIYS